MTTRRYTINESTDSGRIRTKDAGPADLTEIVQKAVAAAARRPGESDESWALRRLSSANATYAPAVEAGQTARQKYLERLASEYEKGWQGIDGAHVRIPNGVMRTGDPPAPTNPKPIGASTSLETEMHKGAKQRSEIARQSEKARRELQARKDRAFAEGWRGVKDSKPSKSTDTAELTPKQAHVKRMQQDAFAAGWKADSSE